MVGPADDRQRPLLLNEMLDDADELDLVPADYWPRMMALLERAPVAEEGDIEGDEAVEPLL